MPIIATGCDTEYEGDEFRDLPNAKFGFAKPVPPGKNAAVNVKSTLQNQSFKNDEAACSVSKLLAGVLIGDQVRIVRNNNEYAVYTVADRQMGDDLDVVRMGQQARQRCGTADPFAGSLIMPVVALGLTDEEAEANDEFVERLVDNGNNQDLVIIAPHGGDIESGTDFQAEAARAALGCSSWICKGYKAGGGGYDRWHITSTKINPRSFPALPLIANRGFAYAVAFHGMSAPGVLIGGGAPDELKEMLQEAILGELSDPDIDVVIAEQGDANSGMSDKNIVNWLTEGGSGGIQLEQSKKVRTDHWEEVVNAVVSVYSQLI